MINKLVLEIPVNENNDTIKINFSDQIFTQNFIELAEYGIKDKLQITGLDLSVSENINKVLDYSKGMAQLIDKAFGVGTTIKIFETTEPTPDLLADFVLQLEPYIEKAYNLKKDTVKKQQQSFEKRSKIRGNLR